MKRRRLFTQLSSCRGVNLVTLFTCWVFTPENISSTTLWAITIISRRNVQKTRKTFRRAYSWLIRIKNITPSVDVSPKIDTQILTFFENLPRSHGNTRRSAASWDQKFFFFIFSPLKSQHMKAFLSVLFCRPELSISGINYWSMCTKMTRALSQAQLVLAGILISVEQPSRLFLFLLWCFLPQNGNKQRDEFLSRLFPIIISVAVQKRSLIWFLI